MYFAYTEGAFCVISGSEKNIQNTIFRLVGNLLNNSNWVYIASKKGFRVNTI